MKSPFQVCPPLRISLFFRISATKKVFLFFISFAAALLFFAFPLWANPLSESGKIDLGLTERRKTLSAETSVRVLIHLKEQPFARVRQETEEKVARVRQNLKRQPNLIKEEKDVNLRRLLTEDHRGTRSRINSEAYTETRKRVESGQRVLAAAVESRGGRIVHRFTLINALSGIVPAGEIDGLSALSEIAGISEDKRMEAHLNISIPSTFADLWWSHGVTGGIHHAAIIDSGMDAAHPAFLGKGVINGTFHATALTDPCYGDFSDSPDDLDGHGTHIAGIVMSQGTAQCPDCIGVAKGSSRIFNLKAAWKDSCTGGASMYISDAMASVDWAESQEESPGCL